jgi:hypothetical protein
VEPFTDIFSGGDVIPFRIGRVRLKDAAKYLSVQDKDTESAMW